MAAVYRNDFASSLDNFFASVNCSVSLDTGSQIEGANSAKMTATASGGMNAFRAQLVFLPASVQTYTWRARLKSTGSYNCFLTVFEYDNVATEMGRNDTATVAVGGTPIDFAITRTTTGFPNCHLTGYVTCTVPSGGDALYVDMMALNSGTDVGWTYIPSTLSGAFSAGQLTGAPNPVKIEPLVPDIARWRLQRAAVYRR